MAMSKEAIHPNAYLTEIRNIRQGMASRTKILKALELGNATAKALTKKSKLTYNVVLHHLWLLEAEKIVLCKRGKKPYDWGLTGIGQQRLKDV